MSKQIVFVLTHVDKWGTATSVYTSREKAQASALELMKDRMLSNWYVEDVAKFNKLTGYHDKLNFFHDFESTQSDGQLIAIVARDVE